MSNWDAFTIEWRGIKFHIETKAGFEAFTEIVRKIGNKKAQSAN
ncbi:hypothetical protein OfM1_19160 [Lactovum odontotermitis]